MRTLNLLPHYFKNIHHSKIGTSIKSFFLKNQSFKPFFYKLFYFLMRTINVLTHNSNWYMSIIYARFRVQTSDAIKRNWYMSINKYEIQYKGKFQKF